MEGQSVYSQIQSAAKACFMEKGWAETTIREIAAKANLSPGAIYRYFKGKKELFDSLNIPEMEQIRPEFEKRRADIIRAALVLFGENGFEGTTMDAIAAKVGVSKATLYMYCESKEDLLVQVLQESDFNLFTRQTKLSEDTEHWQEEVKKVGRSYLKISTQPERVALLRTVIMESTKFPDIGKLYYEKGFRVACEDIANYLVKLKKSGKIQINDENIMTAVHTYLGSIQSFIILNSTIRGIILDYTAEQYLDTTTNLFLDGLQAVKK